MMGLEVSLRTTIEIRDEHRAKLLEMAARRGEKGFSSIVSEAIELLLQAQAELDEARCRALEVRGSLGEREAEDLRKEVSQLRAEWR
jgi:predicted CopG family antitoxin